MAPRSAITALACEGRVLVRAHVWGARGYSTKTFATAGEAQAWAARKCQEVRRHD